MAGWTTHKGEVVALPFENIDTDQIIPARFMSTPRAEGYGQFLFHDMAREIGDDFPLTAAPNASILVARRNFGCGSSREAAVYALVDAGFRVVIAPSFGDIFAANAVNNGLLPARVSGEEAEELINGTGINASVNLAACEIVMAGRRIAFALDPVWQTKLINGWDDIDLTMSEHVHIASFRERLEDDAPWSLI